MHAYNSDTYGILLQRLAALMRRMPLEDAKNLAAYLTSQINRKISSPFIQLEFSAIGQWADECVRVFPEKLMNFATLTLPWDSFRIAHRGSAPSYSNYMSPLKLVCSIPEIMESDMRKISSVTGLWGGTLLDALASLIDQATEEVILISPYWSQTGIDALLRRMTRTNFSGLRMEIITQPIIKHDGEAIIGIRNFKNYLETRGSICTILSPDPTLGPAPLMHAKALVSDGKAAYLGSANFSGRGMDWSVEIGVQFWGPLASQLRDWLFALSKQLRPWGGGL